MSFFDEDDEPRSSPRPRRSAAVGGAPPDQNTLLVRRAAAIGGVVLLLFILFFGFRACASSRKENALKDYNREVSSIIKESDQQVGAPFFQLLSQASSDSPADLQTNISGYRVQAESQLKQAKALSVPDEMKGAQQSLLLALQFRRDGLAAIAEKIRTALGDEGEAANTAITQIAGQMQTFLASDVLYQARVAPLIKNALDDAEIGGQKIASSRFLPGIESVTVGDTKLQPDAPNRLPASADTAFVVRFTNQGDNDEFDVKVTVAIEGGDKPIKVSRTVDTVGQGQTAEATLALGQKPPTGAAVTVKVTVAKVPGEQKTDNNTASYDVLFTG